MLLRHPSSSACTAAVRSARRAGLLRKPAALALRAGLIKALQDEIKRMDPCGVHLRGERQDRQVRRRRPQQAQLPTQLDAVGTGQA